MDVDDEDMEEHRIIHLDLKGASPKITYFEKLFPLLRKWGATGLLVEYEDTFPYSAALENLAAPNAYSKTEISQLLFLAEQNNLMVIPLVQTFGHLEFALKHPEFQHLREIPLYDMTLCPLHEGSMALLKQMIDQVCQLHPHLKYFHIGADEVFHIGFCAKCRAHMQTLRLTKMDVFFMHVRAVQQYISATYPATRVIMWDDMFRNVNIDAITASSIAGLVEPMVWFYEASFELSPDIWPRYAHAFPHVWVAGAYKGATGPCALATDISYHIENTMGWVQTMEQQAHRFQKVRGCVLTGWQRYDHYAVLCELLPVALPSLVLCLLTFCHKTFTPDLHQMASVDLEFTDLIPMNPFKSFTVVPSCSFPGSDIYKGIFFLLQLLSDFRSLMDSDRLNGWMTDFHVERHFSNPAHVNHVLMQAQPLLDGFRQFHSDIQVALAAVFSAETVAEWIGVNVEPKMRQVAIIVDKGRSEMARCTAIAYPRHVEPITAEEEEADDAKLQLNQLSSEETINELPLLN